MSRRRSLMKDERGVAAVEFALLAPFLMLLYFGLVELVSAFQAQKRISHVAMTIADVAAQERAVTDAELDDAMQSGVVLMTPFPTAALSERVASLKANAAGVISVDWVRTRNWTAAGSPSVPAGYLAAGESVIVADVAYTYTPTYTLAISAPITITRHAYVRPRLVDYVEHQ